MASALAGYLTMFTTTALVDDAIAAAADHDIVVVDCMLLPILSALTGRGAPVVALFHTFYSYLDGSFRRGVGIVGRMRGVNVRKIWRATDLRLVVSDRLLDPAGGDGSLPGPVWSGPAEPAARPRIAHPTPVVLASLSTTDFPGQQQTLQRILDAVAQMPVRLILTTGPAARPAALRAPANAEVHQFIPHREVLPDCSAVIGHGGHSTTFQALAHGLPLIIMPMHPLLDQPMVGKAVARSGAGLVLPKRTSPKRIGAALREILDEPSYAAAAEMIAQRLEDGTGASRAADAIVAQLG
jgi:UDP:flavonoid glycosyltransferase YjiC (YdhE family)